MMTAQNSAFLQMFEGSTYIFFFEYARDDPHGGSTQTGATPGEAVPQMEKDGLSIRLSI